MLSTIVRLRSSHGYRVSLAMAGVVLLLASGGVLFTQSSADESTGTPARPVSDGGPAADSSANESSQGAAGSEEGGYAGYAVPAPTSLSAITSKAELVVHGSLVRELGTQTIVFGQSSPLGESQVVRPITLEVRSFELLVDRYVVGTGPATLTLHKSLGGPQPRVGDAGMFFLRKPTEWKIDGFGTT